MQLLDLPFCFLFRLQWLHSRLLLGHLCYLHAMFVSLLFLSLLSSFDNLLHIFIIILNTTILLNSNFLHFFIQFWAEFAEIID